MPAYLPDVNVLVDAWWSGSSHHESARTWLEEAVNGPDTVDLSELIVSGAIRVLTHERIPGLGVPLGRVLDLASTLLSQPGVVRVRSGPRHWSIFRDLCEATGATGNRVPDCYHAALALELDAVFVTRDRFFTAIDGLTTLDPSVDV